MQQSNFNLIASHIFILKASSFLFYKIFFLIIINLFNNNIPYNNHSFILKRRNKTSDFSLITNAFLFTPSKSLKRE